MLLLYYEDYSFNSSSSSSSSGWYTIVAHYINMMPQHHHHSSSPKLIIFFFFLIILLVIAATLLFLLQKYSHSSTICSKKKDLLPPYHVLVMYMVFRSGTSNIAFSSQRSWLARALVTRTIPINCRHLGSIRRKCDHGKVARRCRKYLDYILSMSGLTRATNINFLYERSHGTIKRFFESFCPPSYYFGWLAVILVPLAIMALVAVLVLINSSLDEDRKRKRTTLKTAKGKRQNDN